MSIFARPSWLMRDMRMQRHGFMVPHMVCNDYLRNIAPHRGALVTISHTAIVADSVAQYNEVWDGVIGKHGTDIINGEMTMNVVYAYITGIIPTQCRYKALPRDLGLGRTDDMKRASVPTPLVPLKRPFRSKFQHDVHTTRRAGVRAQLSRYRIVDGVAVRYNSDDLCFIASSEAAHHSLLPIKTGQRSALHDSYGIVIEDLDDMKFFRDRFA
jgi:hypothetical protein